MSATLRRALVLCAALVSYGVAAGPTPLDDSKRVVAGTQDSATLDPAALNAADFLRQIARFPGASRPKSASSGDAGTAASLDAVVKPESGTGATAPTPRPWHPNEAKIASNGIRFPRSSDDLSSLVKASPVEPAAKLGDRLSTFVENKGQWDSRAKFQLRANGKTIWLTDGGVVFDNMRVKPRKPSGKPGIPRLKDHLAVEAGEGFVFAEDFVGAHSSPIIEAASLQPGTYNYLSGSDPTNWHTGAHGFAELVYRNVWDGVDVRLARSGANIEQEFIVHPGADVSQVQIAYRGIDGLEIAMDGSLVVHTAFGDLHESAPRIYQEVGGRREYVNGIRLTGATSYSFEIEAGHRILDGD